MKQLSTSKQKHSLGKIEIVYFDYKNYKQKIIAWNLMFDYQYHLPYTMASLNHIDKK